MGHRSRAVTEKYAKAIAHFSGATAEKTANFLNLSVMKEEVPE